MTEMPFHVSKDLDGNNFLFDTTDFAVADMLLIDELIYRALRVLKITKGEDATLRDFYRLISNSKYDSLDIEDMLKEFRMRILSLDRNSPTIELDIETDNYFSMYLDPDNCLFQRCRPFVSRIFLYLNSGK